MNVYNIIMQLYWSPEYIFARGGMTKYRAPLVILTYRPINNLDFKMKKVNTVKGPKNVNTVSIHIFLEKYFLHQKPRVLTSKRAFLPKYGAIWGLSLITYGPRGRRGGYISYIFPLRITCIKRGEGVQIACIIA